MKCEFTETLWVSGLLEFFVSSKAKVMTKEKKTLDFGEITSHKNKQDEKSY